MSDPVTIRRSLGVNIMMTEAWGQTPEVHKRLCELAQGLWPIRTEYVSVFSNEITEGDEEAEFLAGEYADENTMVLVRETIVEEFQKKQYDTADWDSVEDLIVAFQNAGILFRQRR